MGQKYDFTRLRWIPLILCLLLLVGCGGGGSGGGGGQTSPESKPASSASGTEAEPSEEEKQDGALDPENLSSSRPGSQTASKPPEALRPNTPHVYTPEAPQTDVLGGDPLEIDISNTGRGYVMARYFGGAAKANIQLTGPDGVNYKYFLTPSEEFVPLPLTGGSGAYEVAAYENVEGTKYASLFKENIQVDLEDELLPFLYPNQYVNFDEQSQAVEAAAEIVAPAVSDLDAVTLVYHYIVENVTYDTHKAQTVQSGYLPDVDDTLATNTGICFDYAALASAMLRSQNIPTRLEIGYAGEIYHAWISVYTDETGWIDRVIEFRSDSWTRMDPTFAAGNGNSDQVLQYIGDGSNYTLQYSH